MQSQLASLDTLYQLLDEVEQKSHLFLEPLVNSDLYEIEIGKLKTLYDQTNRAYLLTLPGGMPVWHDITLTARTADRLEIALDVTFSPHDQQYHELRLAQLAATQAKQPLYVTDALEALLRAELVHDRALAEAAIIRISRQFSNIGELLLPLLDKGNSRIRSAVGRLLALLNQEPIWEKLLDYLAQESVEGVRADIIAASIIYAGPQGVPTNVLEHWLKSERLVDTLSCLVALAARGLSLAPSYLELVHEPHRASLQGWFSGAEV